MGRLKLLTLAAFTLSACSSQALIPTPAPPTPTPLEVEEQHYLDAFLAKTEPDGVWHARVGLRVMQPLFHERDDSAWHECPPSFAVAAVEHGLFYFFPGDAIYPKNNLGALFLSLCFASEEDAKLAGYRRGPQ